MTGTDLAVVTPDEISGLPAEQHGELVTRALMESRDWLAVATKSTDPTPIVNFKAWAATVAEMTKQKGLAEDIQLDALEMVRRAERGIGLAIRNGQEAGDISTRHWNNGHEFQGNQYRGEDHPVAPTTSSPSDFARKSELAGSAPDKPGIYAMTDGVTDEKFEESLTQARDERNLGRANVVRKIKAQQSAVPLSRRLEEIAEFARDSLSSRQMAEKLGHSGEHIRRLARSNGIDIPADRLIGNTRLIDPERVVRESVNTLQGVESSLALLRPEDYDTFTIDQLKDWLTAVREPARAVRNLMKELNTRVRSANTTRHEEGGAGSPPPLDPDRQDAGVPAGPAGPQAAPGEEARR